VLKGTCLNCKTIYLGWALREVQHQTCLTCGSLIEVVEYDKAEKQDSMWREKVVIKDIRSAGAQKKCATKLPARG